MATYHETYQVWKSGSLLRERVTVAVAKLAVYLSNSLNSTEKTWAVATIPGTNAEIAADKIFWAIALDANVLAAGDGITDATLQPIVEAACHLYLIGV